MVASTSVPKKDLEIWKNISLIKSVDIEDLIKFRAFLNAREKKDVNVKFNILPEDYNKFEWIQKDMADYFSKRFDDNFSWKDRFSWVSDQVLLDNYQKLLGYYITQYEKWVKNPKMPKNNWLKELAVDLNRYHSGFLTPLGIWKLYEVLTKVAPWESFVYREMKYNEY